MNNFIPSFSCNSSEENTLHYNHFPSIPNDQFQSDTSFGFVNMGQFQRNKIDENESINLSDEENHSNDYASSLASSQFRMNHENDENDSISSESHQSQLNISNESEDSFENDLNSTIPQFSTLGSLSIPNNSEHKMKFSSDSMNDINNDNPYLLNQTNHNQFGNGNDGFGNNQNQFENINNQFGNNQNQFENTQSFQNNQFGNNQYQFDDQNQFGNTPTFQNNQFGSFHPPNNFENTLVLQQNQNPMGFGSFISYNSSNSFQEKFIFEMKQLILQNQNLFHLIDSQSIEERDKEIKKLQQEVNELQEKVKKLQEENDNYQLLTQKYDKFYEERSKVSEAKLVQENNERVKEEEENTITKLSDQNSELIKQCLNLQSKNETLEEEKEKQIDDIQQLKQQHETFWNEMKENTHRKMVQYIRSKLQNKRSTRNRYARNVHFDSMVLKNNEEYIILIQPPKEATYILVHDAKQLDNTKYIYSYLKSGELVSIFLKSGNYHICCYNDESFDNITFDEIKL